MLSPISTISTGVGKLCEKTQTTQAEQSERYPGVSPRGVSIETHILRCTEKKHLSVFVLLNIWRSLPATNLHELSPTSGFVGSIQLACGKVRGSSNTILYEAVYVRAKGVKQLKHAAKSKRLHLVLFGSAVLTNLSPQRKIFDPLHQKWCLMEH